MRMLKRSEQGVSFLELLLDERICWGTIIIDKELVRNVGGINHKLQAKQKYELLLRVAKESPVVFEEVQENDRGYIILQEDSPEKVDAFGWKTDAYVLGKYSTKLQESGYFKTAVSAVIAEAEQCGRAQETIAFLEEMMSHTKAFYHIDDATRPILVYKGDPICHNVLTVFAEQFGAALSRAGEHVIYFDFEKEEVNCVLRYMDQRFKAVVGVQSYLFSIKMLDEIHYLHEYIYGPKFNFIFDHPIWVKSHMGNQYPNYYLLTHDENYVSFAERYFQKKTFLFPPAGMAPQTDEERERIYDITFVGTYGDYMEQILWIHEQERPLRFLANKFLLKMRHNPGLTLEEAFSQTLCALGMELDDEAFVEKLYAVRRAVYCVMHNYRSRVIKTLLDSGLQVDVFGDSWYHCPLRVYPNLICHPDITVEESLTIWQQSKLSLNVMSWHKGGFTERMAGIMLAGAVLVTDDTSYLHGRYDEKDMIVYRLDCLEELPGQIAGVLLEEEKRRKMAENGRRKTEKEHTWDRRAGQFLELLEELSV